MSGSNIDSKSIVVRENLSAPLGVESTRGEDHGWRVGLAAGLRDQARTVCVDKAQVTGSANGAWWPARTGVIIVAYRSPDGQDTAGR